MPSERGSRGSASEHATSCKGYPGEGWAEISKTISSCTGIGILVPPSYLEPWARKHPQFIGALSRIDRALCNLPVFRVIGDHMLLHFEKTGS